MDGYSRTFDVGVAVGLAATLTVFSTAILLTYRLTGRDETDSIPAGWFYATFAMLFAAALGLAAGRYLSFALSASIVLSSTTGSLLTAFIGIYRMFEPQAQPWAVVLLVGVVIVIQISIISAWQKIELVFVTSSIANSLLCVFFILRINTVVRREKFDAGLFLTLPFAAISTAYFLRLTLIATKLSNEVIVIASVGIAFVLSFASVLWVFGALMVQMFRLKKQVEWAARHDPLTRLPNRAALDSFLHELDQSEDLPDDGDVVCLYVDLDHFKRVNDTHGHAAGDAALEETARRLSEAAIQAQAKVFRVGGDEFLFFVRRSTCPDVTGFAENLRRSLGEPIAYMDLWLQIGASIGIAGTAGIRSSSDAMNAADQALYSAKNEGRGRVVHHGQSLQANARGHLRSAGQ